MKSLELHLQKDRAPFIHSNRILLLSLPYLHISETDTLLNSPETFSAKVCHPLLVSSRVCKQ